MREIDIRCEEKDDALRVRFSDDGYVETAPHRETVGIKRTRMKRTGMYWLCVPKADIPNLIKALQRAIEQ